MMLCFMSHMKSSGSRESPPARPGVARSGCFAAAGPRKSFAGRVASRSTTTGPTSFAATATRRWLADRRPWSARRGRRTRLIQPSRPPRGSCKDRLHRALRSFNLECRLLSIPGRPGGRFRPAAVRRKLLVGAGSSRPGEVARMNSRQAGPSPVPRSMGSDACGDEVRSPSGLRGTRCGSNRVSWSSSAPRSSSTN